MSDNNNQPTPEQRRAMVDAALASFKDKHKPTAPTEEDLIIYRAMEVAAKIDKIMKEIIRTDKARGGTFNVGSAGSTSIKLYCDEFIKWPKDELVFLITVMHNEQLMDNIAEADRAGLL